jgi:hypothetical protein
MTISLLVSPEARATAVVAGRETMAARAARPPDFERENRAPTVPIGELSIGCQYP